MAAAALIASALLPLGLGSGLALGWDTALRLEGREQRVVPATGPDTANRALEAQPRLALDAAGRTGDLALVYFPRFTHSEGDSGTRDAWLQLATLAGAWAPDAAWSLRMSGTVTRGTNDLVQFLSTTTAPGSDAPPVAQLAPTTTTIAYQNYDVGLAADGQLSPRLSVRATLGGVREGGLGSAARDVLPLSQAGRLSLGLDWKLTRTDSLGAVLSGTVVHYFDVLVTSVDVPGTFERIGWSTWSNRLGGVWKHAFAPETDGFAGAGVALVGGDGRNQERLRMLPSAEVGVSHAPKLRDQRLQGGITLALAPLEDRLVGAIVERADLRAWITWVPVDRWSLRGATSGGVVVTGQSKKDVIASADLRVGWAAAAFLDVSLGLRGSIQNQPNLNVPRFEEWSAYLALTATHKGRL